MTEEKRKFEPGNCVKLKVFGEPMVVASLRDWDDNGFPGDWCICIWFDRDAHLQRECLHADWLELHGL